MTLADAEKHVIWSIHMYIYITCLNTFIIYFYLENVRTISVFLEKVSYTNQFPDVYIPNVIRGEIKLFGQLLYLFPVTCFSASAAITYVRKKTSYLIIDIFWFECIIRIEWYFKNNKKICNIYFYNNTSICLFKKYKKLWD